MTIVSTRRRLLTVGTLAVVSGMAGCLGDDESGGSESGPDDGMGDSESGDGDEDDTPASDESTESTESEGTDTDDTQSTPTESSDNTPTDDGTKDTSTDPADLDLREANVVGVEFDGGDESYRFSVTLHHDDDGEDGYANWWQVESLDGTQLGRRDLAHPHSTQPFTRSTSLDVPEDVTCVVVRGHDQTHEYGGVAMLVDIESGAMRAVDQGTDPQAFESSDCP